MTKRHVVAPLMSYRDPDGKMRHALSGEDVDVHPDHVARFDELNGAPEDTPPPKHRGRPPKKKP